MGTSHHRQPSNNSFSVWWVGVIIVSVITLIFRLPLLNGSFWLDEAAQALESARPLAQQLDIIPDFQPPLLHLLLHAAMYLGKSEAWLRTIGALVPGVLIVAITFVIGQKIGGKKVALIASLLLATSSFHIFYSQELRPYALPALWAALSWAWLILKTSASSQTPSRNWLWYAAVTTLGLYSSYLYPFVVLGQLGYVFLWQRSRWWPYTVSLMMAAVCFLPWVPTFLQQLHAGGNLRTTLPGWSEVVSTPQLKALPLVGLKFVFGVLNVEPTGSFIVVSMLILISGVFLAWSAWQMWRTIQVQERETIKRTLGWLSCWLVIPIASAWLVSFWVPVIQPKRVLFALPAFYLLVAYISQLVTQHQKRWSRWTAMSLVAVLMLTNLFATTAYFTQPLLQRENWRQLHQTLAGRYSPNSAIAVFAFDAPFAPWEWYDDGSYSTLSVMPIQIKDESLLAEKLKSVTDYQYVILFDYLRDLTDPQHRLESYLHGLGYAPVEIIDQPNIGFVRVYTRPEARLSELTVKTIGE